MAERIIFKAFRGKKSEMPVQYHDGYIYFTTDEGKLYIDAKQSNGSIRRHQINPDYDITGGVISDTTQHWNSNPGLIGKKDIIYVYSDYQKDSQGNNIPGLKIGDGSAYLIDSPFIDTSMLEHINDKTIHITDEQREFWNNKVRCYCSEIQDQTIVFTTL